jgi:hypothetical protein
MTPLNWVEGSNEAQFKITVTSPKTFKIPVDTTDYPDYVSGGLAVELKEHFHLSFVCRLRKYYLILQKPLAESIKEPLCLDSDFAKLGRSTHLHVAMQALHKFWEQNGSLPRPWNAEDAETLVALAKSLDVSINPAKSQHIYR